MNLSSKSIEKLAEIVIDVPYRKGMDLVALFNKLGFNDTYGQGFPSRHFYAREKIQSINGTKLIRQLIASVLDPRDFVEYAGLREETVEKLNKYLKFDGYEIIQKGDFYKVRNLNTKNIKVGPSPFVLEREYLDEQIEKCEQKLSEADYDGAITNARTLVEAVFLELEKNLDASQSAYDGNLPRLYKRVQKLLNLEPRRGDISEPLRQVLSGLVSIVNGISSARNKMSDAHATRYKPIRHHSELVVNVCKVVVGFMFDTYQYQMQKGALK